MAAHCAHSASVSLGAVSCKCPPKDVAKWLARDEAIALELLVMNLLSVM